MGFSKSYPPHYKDKNPHTQASLSVSGTLKHFIYLDDHNDFAIAKFESESGEIITILGALSALSSGEQAMISGHYEMNERFGQQFRVENFRMLYPTSDEGLIAFLGGGLFPGIRRGFAQKIVEHFGSRTIETISQNPDALNDVKGLGSKKIESLKNTWKEYFTVKDIMMFLQGFGISATFAGKIFKTYGNMAIEKVKTNPYHLAHDISGIGFVKADQIAEQMGIQKDSPQRIQAAFLHVIEKATEQQGHTCLPLTQATLETQKLLDLEQTLISQEIETLVHQQKIIIYQNQDQAEFVYLKVLYQAEHEIARELERLIHEPSGINPMALDYTLSEVTQKIDFSLSDRQIEAVKAATTQKITLITGGPGTGKTTLVKMLVYIFNRLNITLSLCAPTGRASKRLQESSGMEAKTIHRLLEYNPNLKQFMRNRHNPLETQVLIADETSMIDIFLMNHLLKALKNDTILILVGDADQLPSVGPGMILRDLIDSSLFPTIHLDTIYRQGSGSDIIVNAHLINQGQALSLEKDDPHFFFIRKQTPEDMQAALLELVKTRIPAKYQLDPVRDIQVLSPMYKTPLGVTQLNELLQKELNPEPRVSVRGQFQLSAGDKVMQLMNNYDKEVYNGDIGFVETIDPENKKIWVRFENRTIPYLFSESEELVLAYATTIHKSQGSEYPAVIIPVTTQHYVMLQRNLLYTAVTRGKQLVILIGTEKAVNLAIGNNKTHQRFGFLKEKILSLLPPSPAFKSLP